MLEERGRANGNLATDPLKTNFFPSRHEIGYEPDRPKDGNSPLTKRDLNECRALELQCEKQKNGHLEEKIRVLESRVNGKKEYFTTNNEHKIYVQIAKENGSRVYNKETMDRNRIQNSHPKYYLGEYYKTCWHYGAHEHYKERCLKRDAQAKKSRRAWNRKDQGFKTRNSVHIARNSLDINIVEYAIFKDVFLCKEPGKRHLAWVAKN